MCQLSHAFTSLLRACQPSPPPAFVMPPLITAVLNEQTETVRQLLVGGADTSAMDDLYYNALHYAAMGGLKEILLLLLCNGAKIDAKTGTGSNLTALALAVASEEVVVGKILIARGATIAPQSLTAVGMETYNRWIAELPVASGQEINDEAPPQIVLGQLSRAWTSLLQVFHQPTPRTNYRDPPPGFVMPPLIKAVYDRQPETVRQLLASGADTSAMDDLFHNPLHCAVNWGQVEVVLLLLHNGAHMNAVIGRGPNLTPLALAVAGDEEVIGKILIGRGASIEHDSISPWGMAIYNRWVNEYRHSLLDTGVDRL